MSDDIVNKLRDHLGKNLKGHLPCIRCSAADEIERLQTELDTYKDLYAAEIVDKAVRGE